MNAISMMLTVAFLIVGSTIATAYADEQDQFSRLDPREEAFTLPSSSTKDEKETGLFLSQACVCYCPGKGNVSQIGETACMGGFINYCNSRQGKCGWDSAMQNGYAIRCKGTETCK